MLSGLLGIKREKGFTLIELVITISVIAILTTISILGYSQYQASGRDSTRQARATALTEALEKYYDSHGEYPSCSQLTQSPSVVSETVLPGIDTSVLRTPGGSDNSISCTDLTNVSNGDYFAYVGDTSQACVGASGNACVLFSLKYIKESESAIAQIDSRRKTSLVDSQVPTLTTTASGFTTVNTSWTGVPGSVSYTLQYSNTLTFPAETTANSANSGTINLNGSTTSRTVSSLAYNDQYYFRIKASNATGTGAWSTTRTATTWNLATPSLTTTASGFYSVSASWGAITNAASYTLQYSTSTTFPAETTANSATSGTLTTASTSSSVGSLNSGTLYYFRVKATAPTSPVPSGWSTTRSATTWTLTTPVVTCGSITTSSATCTWPAIANATSYDYRTNINAAGWSGASSQTGLSRVMSHGTQGTNLYIQVKARNGSVESPWSDVVLATLAINGVAWNRWNQTEAYPSWSSWIDRTDGGAICPAGTALYSRFRDGVAPGWNGWGAYSNRGINATRTATYTSTIANYSSTLQAQIAGYCRNETTGAQSAASESSVYTSIHSTPPGAVLSGAQSCVAPYNIRPQFDLVLTLQETSMNVAANTSVVNWTAYRRANGNVYNTWNGTLLPQHQHNVVVHGTSVKNGQSASQRFRYSYATWSTEALYNNSSANVNSVDSGAIGIAHNADGTATINGAISDTFNGQVFGTAGCSFNYTLSDLR